MRFSTENWPLNLEAFEAKGNDEDCVRLDRVLAEAEAICRVRLAQLAAIVLLCSTQHEAFRSLGARDTVPRRKMLFMGWVSENMGLV